ncbi:MAG: hypothetical protein QMB94_13015, partial [Phycisphaerales bacterium]
MKQVFEIIEAPVKRRNNILGRCHRYVGQVSQKPTKSLYHYHFWEAHCTQFLSQAIPVRRMDEGGPAPRAAIGCVLATSSDLAHSI